MSAWIVSQAHIAYMVEAASRYSVPYGVRWEHAKGVDATVRHNTVTTDDGRDLSLHALGFMLWEENHRSINYRYAGDHESTPEYVHKRTASIDAVILLKAISCYEYQSCEHPGWKDSSAFRFCLALRDAAIDKLPGYDDAPWGIDDIGDEVISLMDMIRLRKPSTDMDALIIPEVIIVSVMYDF